MINQTELRNIPGFDTLKGETLLAITRRAFEREMQVGHTLVIECMPAEFCYFLITGQVRVLRMSQEGRIQILDRQGPGAPLNIISLLIAERVNRASIETLTPVKVLILDATSFDLLLAEHPDFSRMLLQIFAERIAKITDLAANLSLHTVRARLARFLVALADQPPIAGGWTQDEIAAHVGTVRDVVGRLLREFESEGLIARHRGRITLLDRSSLSKTADGTG